MFLVRKSVVLLLAMVLVLSVVVGVGCDGDDEDTDTVNRIATLETSMGTIKFELYEQRAPVTTANFINLADSGYYNGLIFHRVMDDFMIQTGWGDSVSTIAFEAHEELTHVDGAVSMASTASFQGGSSQFFICDGAEPDLDSKYAVFGQVIEGLDVVRDIASVECDMTNPQAPKPLADVVMENVTIESA